MKVEKSTVAKLRITDIMGEPHRLDPITVILEDIAPRQGKIIIECYGESWASYWGGMGEQTIAQFFCSCNEDYIAENLSQSIDSTIIDSESIQEGALKEIIKLRRGRMIRSFLRNDKMVRYGRKDIDKDEARELWEEVEIASFSDDGWNESELLTKIFGDEWWYHLPAKPNPKYQYLCRIIKAVQEALKS